MSRKAARLDDYAIKPYQQQRSQFLCLPGYRINHSYNVKVHVSLLRADLHGTVRDRRFTGRTSGDSGRHLVCGSSSPSLPVALVCKVVLHPGFWFRLRGQQRVHLHHQIAGPDKHTKHLLFKSKTPNQVFADAMMTTKSPTCPPQFQTAALCFWFALQTFSGWCSPEGGSHPG